MLLIGLSSIETADHKYIHFYVNTQFAKLSKNTSMRFLGSFTKNYLYTSLKVNTNLNAVMSGKKFLKFELCIRSKLD